MPQGTLEAPLVAGRHLIDWDPESKRMVFSLQGPRHNLNLWLYDIDKKAVSQLTFVPTGGISQRAFVEPRHEKYSTFDGLNIPVLIYDPEIDADLSKLLCTLTLDRKVRRRLDSISSYNISLTMVFSSLLPM